MIASQQSIAHMQSPWPCPLRILRRDERKQKEERREKRANGRQPDSLNFNKVPEGREILEKSRTLRETREERKEKQEERDNHNPDERAEESNSSVSEWCRKRSRLLGTEPMA